MSTSATTRILIADDRRPTAEWLGHSLRDRHGYEIDIAISGEDAVRLVHEQAGGYDFALLDQRFRGRMTGLHAMLSIHADYPHVPVVIMTGYPEMGIDALKAGAYRYILKPVDPDEISILIEHVVEQERLRRAMAESNREQRWLESAQQVANAVLSSSTTEEVVEGVYQRVREITPLQCFLLALPDDKGGLATWCRDSLGMHTNPAAVESVLPLLHGVIQTGQPIAVADGELNGKLAAVAESTIARLSGSALCLPLWEGDRTMGAIAVFSPAGVTIDAVVQRIFEAVAHQIALSAKKLEQSRDLADQRDEARLLHDVGHLLASLRDEDELLAEVLLILRDRLGFPSCAFLTKDEQRGELVIRAAYNYPDDIASRAGLKLGSSRGISVQVAETGQLWNVPDVRQEPRYVPGMVGALSNLAVPLTVGAETVGVLNVESAQLNAFGKREERILMSVAVSLATALENARLLKQAQRTAERLQLVEGIRAELAAALEPTELFETILTRGMKAVRAERGSLMRLGPDDNLHIDASYGPDFTRAMKALTLAPGAGVAGWVILHQRPYLCRDIREDALFVPVDGFVDRSLLCVPVSSYDRVIGVLSAHHPEPGFFSPEDEQLLAELARHVATAIERSLLVVSIRRIHAPGGTEEALLERITDMAASLLHVSVAIVRRLNLATGDFEVAAVRGATTSDVRTLRYSIHERRIRRFLKDYRLHRRALSLSDVQDPTRSPRYGHHREAQQLGFVSLLAAPLVVAGRPLGMLELYSRRPRCYVPWEKGLLAVFAEQSARALDTFYRSERLTQVSEISRDVALLHDKSAVVKTVLDQVLHLAGAESGWVYLHDWVRDTWSEAVSRGTVDEGEGSARGRLQRARQVALDGQAQYSPRLRRAGHRRDVPRSAGSAFAAPLFALQDSERRVIGVLGIESPVPDAFSNEVCVLATELASLAGDSVERIELEAQTQRRLNEVRELHQMGLKISSAEFAGVLEEIAATARRMLGADAVVFFPYDDNRKDFEPLERAVVDGLDHGRLRQPRPTGATWQVAEKGLIRVEDLAAPIDPAMIDETYRRDLLGMGVRSLIGLAIRHDGRIVEDRIADGELLGVLFFDFYEARRFTPEQERLALVFANQAGLAIQSARLHREAVDRVSQLNTLLSVLEQVAGMEDLEGVLHAIARGARRLLEADVVILRQYEQADQAFSTPIYEGDLRDPETELKKRVSPESVLYRIIARTDPMYVEKVEDDDVVRRDFTQREGIASVAALPLRVGEESVGAMFLNWRDPHVFTSAEKTLIQLFAQPAAIAIHRARLVDKRLREAAAVRWLGILGSAIGHRVKRPAWVIWTDATSLKELVSQPDGLASHQYDVAEILDSLTRNAQRAATSVPSLPGYDTLEPVDLAVILDELQRDVPGHVAVHVGCRDVPPVLASRGWIRYALEELTQNAIREMPDGGEIWFKGWVRDGMVHLEVVDSGPGFPADLRERIFKEDILAGAREEGFGLALVQEIIQRYGGSVELVNPAPSTTIAIRLPVAP